MWPTMLNTVLSIKCLKNSPRRGPIQEIYKSLVIIIGCKMCRPALIHNALFQHLLPANWTFGADRRSLNHFYAVGHWISFQKCLIAWIELYCSLQLQHLEFILSQIFPIFLYVFDKYETNIKQQYFPALKLKGVVVPFCRMKLCVVLSKLLN